MINNAEVNNFSNVNYNLTINIILNYIELFDN